MTVSVFLIVAIFFIMLKTPAKITTASSTFIVCFSSLTGFLSYASTQNINWLFILLAVVASFAGGQTRARIMSTRLKGKSIRIIFSTILIGLCAKLLHQCFLV